MSADVASVKSALRVLLVIELLTRHHRGLTFVEIHEHLDVPRSSLHGLLRTMVSRGHLVLDPETRTYRLGVRSWEAGQAFLRGLDLAKLARPHLERASAALNETVQLAILDGIENVYIAKVEGDQHLRLVSEVGSRLPAYATGLGKVLLAGLEPDELDRRLAGVDLEAFTPNTITEPARLADVLEEVRELGYATDDGEYTPGVFCVAVPVRGPDGGVVAAMSVSVPKVRLATGSRRQLLQTLSTEAVSLSTELGYRHPGDARTRYVAGA